MSELSIFLVALEIADPVARAAYLDTACTGDPNLRQRFEALLQAHQQTGSFMNRPAPDLLGMVDPPINETTGVLIAGRYKLLEAIGEGGMGTVWVAEQTEPVHRKVALKLIKPGMDSRNVLARFEAERQALAIMDHPNIAKVLDGGLTDAGRPFFVMEYVKGVPITEYCDAARLSVFERLQLFVPVCQAVQHAHQKGIIHRDLKPSNILVALYDDRPLPKVIDFGLAKAMHHLLTERTLHTAHDSALGTPLYMSPEQALFNNIDVDTRTDIYSLGVLLYELLTGTTPLEKRRFTEAAWDEIRRIIRDEEPPRPSARLSSTDTLPSLAACRHTEPASLRKLVRGDLDWIVMKALEKDRSRRYETANGFAMDVQRYLVGEAVLAAPPTTRYRLAKFAKRNRAALMTAVALAALLVIGVIGTTWGLFQARAAAAAEKQANFHAQKRLAQLEKSNDVITSIFTDLDIEMVRAGTEPLEVVLAQRLIKSAEQLDGEAVGDVLVVAALQDRLGESLLSLAHPQEAMELFRKGLETRMSALGETHPDALESMNHLAEGHRITNNLDQALMLHLRTLKLRQIHLPAGHHDTLESMNNLAMAHQANGRLDLAVPLFDETLKLSVATLGEDHIDTLRAANNLALAYQVDRKPNLAAPLHKKTLEARQKKLPTGHPDTLSSMSNLAECYYDLGKLDLAVRLLEETTELAKKYLGADHLNTLTTVNNLALAYQAGEKLNRALPLFDETLKRLRARRLPPKHPLILRGMNNLARAYQAAKDFDRALPLFVEVLQLATETLSADHPHTLTIANNLGLAYQSAGKLELAIQTFMQTLDRAKSKPGKDHPLTLMIQHNLAIAYEASGKLELALTLFREVAAAMDKEGLQNPSAGRALTNLCNCLERLKQFPEAESWRRKWLAVVKVHSGADSDSYAGELAVLGSNLLQQQKWTDAEAVLRECLAICEKKKPDEWKTFSTKSMLGAALLGQKRYADAEPLLLAGYEGIKQRIDKIPMGGKAQLIESLERLVQLYEASGKPDEAVKRRKELEEVKAITPQEKP